MEKQIKITDATLREGSQTRAGTFSISQSIEVAKRLKTLPVDIVECGHPSASDKEFERVKAVVSASHPTPVLAHARLNLKDIIAVAKTGAKWVGIFVGVNESSKEYKYNWKDSNNLKLLIADCIRTAKENGLKIRFTVEDSSRTDLDVLKNIYSYSITEGVDRICFSDTVGLLEPKEVYKYANMLNEWFPGIDKEFHFHDDRGLALANALAAADSGIDSVSTSVNGLGERSGITDTVSYIINISIREKADILFGKDLLEISELVGAYSRSMPDQRRPFVGELAFHHASRLHQLSVEKNPSTYELIEPEKLGRNRSFGSEPITQRLTDLITKPPIISATELKYHRTGPGDRYVLIDDRFVRNAGQYCIARNIPNIQHIKAGHVDRHAHKCDSLFIFLGDSNNYEGLEVEVMVNDETQIVCSPASVFIPAGSPHYYRVISGGGTYINHVLSGNYNSSLLNN